MNGTTRDDRTDKDRLELDLLLIVLALFLICITFTLCHARTGVQLSVFEEPAQTETE